MRGYYCLFTVRYCSENFPKTQLSCMPAYIKEFKSEPPNTACCFMHGPYATYIYAYINSTEWHVNFKLFLTLYCPVKCYMGLSHQCACTWGNYIIAEYWILNIEYWSSSQHPPTPIMLPLYCICHCMHTLHVSLCMDHMQHAVHAHMYTIHYTHCLVPMTSSS